MNCHGPLSEDVDDEEGEFLEAAVKDVALAASLLMCLSRRRRPTTESASTAAEVVSEFHRGLGNWGCRRWRSRGTAKEGASATKTDDVNRASPTTPLSWSGGSGTSESVCEDQGWGGYARPQKRPTTERSLQEHAEQAVTEMAEPSPSKRPRAEESRSPASTWTEREAASEDGALRVFIPLEPSAVGSSIAAPNKEVCLVSVSPAATARGEPVKSRPGSDSTSPAGVRRTGKKKTLSELRIMEESLLRDRADLEKMLDEQRKILAALREENLRMTKLKSEGGRREGALFIDLNSVPEEEP
ncbi:uncharacterized protein LOC144712865 [Wolffia australiana]